MVRYVVYFVYICCCLITLDVKASLEEYKDDEASMIPQCGYRQRTLQAVPQSYMYEQHNLRSHSLQKRFIVEPNAFPKRPLVLQQSQSVQWLSGSSAFKKLCLLAQNITDVTTNDPMQRLKHIVSFPLKDALISKEQRLEYQKYYYQLYLEALIQDDQIIQKSIESAGEKGWSALENTNLLEVVKWVETQDLETARMFKDLLYSDFIYQMILSDSQIPVGQLLLLAIDQGNKKAFDEIIALHDLDQRLDESFFLKLWERAVKKKAYDFMFALLNRLLLQQDSSQRTLYFNTALASNNPEFLGKFTTIVTKILSSKPDLALAVMNEFFVSAADYGCIGIMKILSSIDKYEISQKFVDDALTKALSKRYYTIVEAFLLKSFNSQMYPSEEALGSIRRQADVPEYLKSLIVARTPNVFTQLFRYWRLCSY